MPIAILANSSAPDNYLGAVFLVLAFASHFALQITLYNRLNSFGIARRTIKRIVKVQFIFTITLPVIVIAIWFRPLSETADGSVTVSQIPSVFPALLLAYGGVCLAAAVWFGIGWVIYRPLWGIHWVDARRDITVVDVQRQVSTPLPLTSKCRRLSRYPLNQHLELSIERIELPVRGLPKRLNGYKIAHLSDVHFTGHIHPDYTAYVVKQANAWRPDLMALTGDIIDRAGCIEWLPGVFAGSEAIDGCFFVLGNHDTRIIDSDQTRHAMSAAGWTDLGSRTLAVNLAGVPSRLIGNEFPWFARPMMPGESGSSGNPENDCPEDPEFRLLLSHSPDQLAWARKHNVTLMLAGHTHGGQGRLPIAGPLLSPSRYGSRYASGDFYLPPTTMHVTRGLSGTHLIRINCRPELSLLTLVSDDR